jgi:hypothetical protein
MVEAGQLLLQAEVAFCAEEALDEAVGRGGDGPYERICACADENLTSVAVERGEAERGPTLTARWVSWAVGSSEIDHLACAEGRKA